MQQELIIYILKKIKEPVTQPCTGQFESEINGNDPIVT